MPEATLPELIAMFQALNPTSCETSEIIDLQHRMGTVRLEDQDMRRIVQQFLALDAEAATDEDISYLQARMGRAMERLNSKPTNQTPSENSTSGDPMMEQSALKWISETAKAMGVADENDGLFFQARGLTGWIEGQLAHNKSAHKALDILRSTLENRGFRTDGDSVTLAERCKLMALEDKDLFRMKEGNNNLLKERLAKAQEQLGELLLRLEGDGSTREPESSIPSSNTLALQATLDQIREHIRLKKDRQGQVPTLYELLDWEASLQEILDPKGSGLSHKEGKNDVPGGRGPG